MKAHTTRWKWSHGYFPGVYDTAEQDIDYLRSRLAHEIRERRRVCNWKSDDDGIWSTDCGHAWFFDTGDPKENNARFCPYCGKRLIQHEHVDIPDDEE